jgi:hypothetical protein
MAKQGGSLPRGRRLRHEVLDVPSPSDLTHVEKVAQAALRSLVGEAGGRFESTKAIPIGNVSELADLFDAWGRRHANDKDGELYFAGQPGLWHALDELYPLQDPNRWDRLRQEVIRELEERGWRRASPPRGVTFYLPT